MTPFLRAATAADAAEVVRLAAMMFATIGVDAHDAGWRRAGERAVSERLGRDLAVFVAEDPAAPGRLVASVAGTVARRLPTPHDPSGLAGYVQWVATEAAWRRQGLGSALMTRLLDWYADQGAGRVELHATRDGEGVYRALGFSEGPNVALRRRM